MLYPNPYGIVDENLEKALSIAKPENLQVATAMLADLQRLREAARKAGFELKLESAYRSYERQLSIWNRKARGELTLRDASGEPFTTLPADEESMMFAILLWSALPGGSRHHFGSEIDVSDALHTPAGYEVDLTPQECDGMFKEFHDWISEETEANRLFGFKRVFVPGRGKVQPEKWHLSHIPTARQIQKNFSEMALQKIYAESDIACKNAILDNLPKLLDNYVYPYFL